MRIASNGSTLTIHGTTTIGRWRSPSQQTKQYSSLDGMMANNGRTQGSHQQIKWKGSPLHQTQTPMIRMTQLSNTLHLPLGIHGLLLFAISPLAVAFRQRGNGMSLQKQLVGTRFHGPFPRLSRCHCGIDRIYMTGQQDNVSWPARINQILPKLDFQLSGRPTCMGRTFLLSFLQSQFLNIHVPGRLFLYLEGSALALVARRTLGGHGIASLIKGMGHNGGTFGTFKVGSCHP
mmetsp:Transcript_17917/g.44304  ORF Transcript_17917/g.44304 Transcript_17917/m.44304 type:complete len:233 (-) Transcript_17917:52-750(-)